MKINKKLLGKFDMTMDELELYLDTRNKSLDDFKTISELDSYLLKQIRLDSKVKKTPQKQPIVAQPKIIKKFGTSAKDYAIQANNGYKGEDVMMFWDRIRASVLQILRTELTNNAIKFNFVLEALAEKDGTSHNVGFANSEKQSCVLINTHNMDTVIDTSWLTILKRIDEFIDKGSDWIVKNASRLIIKVYKYTPIMVGTFVELPSYIKNTNSCVNIKNDDKCCFKWSILSYLYPHCLTQQSLRSRNNCLDFTNIEFPVTNQGIQRFEKQNTDYSICVIGCESNKRKIYPVKFYSNINAKHKVMLLLVKNHYCRIKNLSLLLGYDQNRKQHVCENCFCGFSNKIALSNHQTNGCVDNSEAILKFLPSDKAYVQFTQFNKQIMHPFVIYCDFESIIVDNKHIGCSYGYVICSTNDKYNKPFTFYRGKNAIYNFLTVLHEEKKWILNVLYKHYDIGARWKIPVIFHNLRGYDGHLIMQEIGKFTDDITVIPNTTEKYISFTMGNLQFIDSYQHLSESLNNLSHGIGLKGIYPYSYMDDLKRFDELHLPSIEHFYNDLTRESCSNDDYEYAKNVWTTHKCKNLGDYHDVYLKNDVHLLSTVFENYRRMCMSYYKLDPCNYLTSPSLSWDALLLMTNKKIGCFNSDQVDMLLMIERGKRGGVCMISKRYAKSTDKTKILYLDANNLYGWAMKQPLPTGNYKYIDPLLFNNDNIMELSEHAKTGYIFEVDLTYPVSLHDEHNDYPLAPENIKSEYSPFMENIMNTHECKLKNCDKLIPNLYDKKKYVVHYRNLQFYLSHGLILTKIHTIISFDQESWMKKYIDFNTKHRKTCEHEFEKNFFKLMNNSIFGKTCENVRKRINVKLLTTEENFGKYTKLPTFASGDIIIDDELFMCKMRKTFVKFDKPVIIGMCILDLSKLLMYHFHYDVMKKTFNDINLLYTDTDSLIYEITDPQLSQKMDSIKEWLDTSNDKIVGKFKDVSNGYQIDEFIGLRPKCYSYTVNGINIKKAKGVSNGFVKYNIVHEDYKTALFGNTKNELVKHASFKILKSTNHIINTVEVNKISMTSFDNKRLVSDDNIHTKAIGYNVCV